MPQADPFITFGYSLDFDYLARTFRFPIICSI